MYEMSVYASAKSSVGTFCQDKAALVSRIPADRYGKLSISFAFRIEEYVVYLIKFIVISMKTIREDKLKCYIGHSLNDDNTPYSFCLMPESGIPTIEKINFERVQFMDESVDNLLTLDQQTELKKILNTISYKVLNKTQEEPAHVCVTYNYCWMEFEFTVSITAPDISVPADDSSTVKVTTVKVTNENVKRFLDELRAKKKADLDELERKFIYYFGNPGQNVD